MIRAASAFPGYQLVLAAAPGISPEYYAKFVKGTELAVIFDRTYRLLQQADVALVTSGTATLETALFRVPQVVCYHTPVGKLVSFLRRHILKVKFISLVNLIAGREVVRELVADTMTVENMRAELECLLFREDYRRKMLDGYEEMARLLWMAMLTLMLPALQSCDDNDGYSLGDIAVDWATVRVVGGDTYSLNADRWGTLWPAATAIPFYKPIDGQRVITYFNPLYDNYEGYDHAVKVEHNYNVLTKQVEDLTAENESEFGNDPVWVNKDMMWIGGGYLNVIFRQNLPVKEKHLVSLVRDMRATAAEGEDDEYIHLEFRYKTYDDVTARQANGAVSFNLNSLDLTGKKGIKVKLNSVKDGETEVVFNLKGQSMPEEAKQVTLSDEVQIK